MLPVASETAMQNHQLNLIETPQAPARKLPCPLGAYQAAAREYKLVPLRETPAPDSMLLCDTPSAAAGYWRQFVTSNPYFNPEVENVVVLIVNSRRRVKCHSVLSQGTIDCVLIHPREIFRIAIIQSAAAVIVMHNHPSGEPTPSEADIKITRDLIRAGQLLKIECLDHVIMGHSTHVSLRELGYFYS